MTIDAIENNAPVVTPTGHSGRVRVTRRERERIAEGKQADVQVLGTDGRVRLFPLAQLEERAFGCYQCRASVNWLAPDRRCAACTSYTPEEIGDMSS